MKKLFWEKHCSYILNSLSDGSVKDSWKAYVLVHDFARSMQDNSYYRLGTGIQDALARTTLNVTSELFPSEVLSKWVYVELAKPIINADRNFDFYAFATRFTPSTGTLIIIELGLGASKGKIIPVIGVTHHQHSNGEIEAMLAEYPDYEAVYRLVANTLVYINSGQPDLRHLQPKSTSSKSCSSFKKKLLQDETELPVTLVGFNFKKPTLYSVNETSVSGHYRWQPCGTRREQVKLIWINEHVRKYSNVVDLSEKKSA